jgi:hypothetical protein
VSSLQYVLHALNQGLEQRLLVEPGQSGVRQCLYVMQPGIKGRRTSVRRERYPAR